MVKETIINIQYFINLKLSKFIYMPIKGLESKTLYNLQVVNKGRLIERMLQIGGKDIKTNIAEDKIENLTENTKNITNDMRVNAVSKLMTVAINEAAQSSKADIVSLLSASNRLSLKDIKVGADFNLTGVKQKSTVDSNVDGQVTQDLQSKIANDFTKNISKTFSQKISNTESIKDSLKTGTDVGGVVSGAINAVADVGETFITEAASVVKDVLSLQIGGDKEETNITKNHLSNTIKDTLNLNNPLVIEDSDNISDDIKNLLSQENMAKCASEAAAENNIDIANASVGGNMNISDIEQVSVVTSALKCTFNQKAISEMATKIVTNIDKLYEQISETILEKESEEQAGDLLALGEAGKAVLTGAGEAVASAAVGTGEGFATAAEGAGAGVAAAAEGAGAGIAAAAEGAGAGISAAAKGVGEGASKITDSLMWPLIIGGVVIAIGLVVFLVIKFGGGSKGSSRGSGGYDDYGEY